MKTTTTAILALALLTGCSQPGQNRYGYQDVGRSTTVAFGTVISEREVDITGPTTGVGATAGALGGALGGSYIGNGGGSLGAMLAGAVIAGVAGQMAEQAISDHRGIEYVVTVEKGDTLTIVQNLNAGEQPVKVGHRCMVQNSGAYQRVLPADDLPTSIKRPKRIKVTD